MGPRLCAIAVPVPPFARFAFLRVRGAVVDAQKRRVYREEQHDSIDEWLEAESARGVVYMQRAARYLADRGRLPDHRAARSERFWRLRTAVASLAPEERSVIQRALAGELAGQIAARYGRSPNWARARLHAALDKLAAQLKQQEAAWR